MRWRSTESMHAGKQKHGHLPRREGPTKDALKLHCVSNVHAGVLTSLYWAGFLPWCVFLGPCLDWNPRPAKDLARVIILIQTSIAPFEMAQPFMRHDPLLNTSQSFINGFIHPESPQWQRPGPDLLLSHSTLNKKQCEIVRPLRFKVKHCALLPWLILCWVIWGQAA